jgi:uncharacterized membrane protein HdeD (DUF308 family)
MVFGKINWILSVIWLKLSIQYDTWLPFILTHQLRATDKLCFAAIVASCNWFSWRELQNWWLHCLLNLFDDDSRGM